MVRYKRTLRKMELMDQWCKLNAPGERESGGLLGWVVNGALVTHPTENGTDGSMV